MVLFLVALAHILHAQIVTCTVMVVHGGGSGVMEVVPWDSSMWWLYNIGCTCICMWQSVLAVVQLRASLPFKLAGFSTNTLSPFVSPYVNVEVSGGDGALVRKLAFSGECASG